MVEPPIFVEKLIRRIREADNLTMSDVVSGVTVTRWRRYGKDRLYVSAADGDLKIGWWDLVSGAGHPESPEHLGTLLAAVEGWKVGDVMPAAEATVVADGSLAPITSEVAVKPADDPLSSLVAEPIHPTAQEHIPVVTIAGPQPAARPWIDLATNRAGAEAREQALAARDAAPVEDLPRPCPRCAHRRARLADRRRR